MSYKEIFGCAAFGLADQVLQIEGERKDPSFYLADAVLPAHPSGTIRTGSTAEQERIHSGLSWPPEARIKSGAYMRRAPIPCVWNGLVSAGDQLVRWNVGRGVSFTLSRIISRHLADLLVKNEFKAQDMAVVAIPDALDEFGQESLLRDLKILGFENVQLLWRPVAAALSWLSELDQNNALNLDTTVREHIIVVYLGPDGVEMATFQLHRQDSKNGKFVIPIRERPLNFSSVTGFDWCANTIENFHSDLDDGAFWQAFTNFPHVWEAMSGRPFSSNEDIWSFEDYWTFWSPNEKIIDSALDVSASPNIRLRTILSKSCPLLNAGTENKKESVEEGLAKLFVSTLDQNKDSQLRYVSK